MPAQRKKLGEILVTAGVLDETHLHAGLAEQRRWGGRLGRTLVEMGFVDETTMCAALSRQLQLPAIDLLAVPLEARVTDLLAVDLCERYGVMPVSADRERKAIKVATSDPTNYEALRDIGFRTGFKVEPMVTTASGVDKAIRHYYYGEAMDSAATARPADLGLKEPEFTAEEISGPRRAAVPRQGRTGSASAGPPDSSRRSSPGLAGDDAVAEGLRRLEGLFATQVHALRILVEMMVEKGLISRDDYLARVKTGNRGPGSGAGAG